VSGWAITFRLEEAPNGSLRTPRYRPQTVFGRNFGMVCIIVSYLIFPMKVSSYGVLIILLQ
jgi:hypothetical protein